MEQLERLESTIKFVKEQLKKCKNQKSYRDNKRYLDRLYQERSTYKRLRGIK